MSNRSFATDRFYQKIDTTDEFSVDCGVAGTIVEEATDEPRPVALLRRNDFADVGGRCASSCCRSAPRLRDYRFIPSKTTVHVSGGPSDYNLNLTIAGELGLVTGYNEELDPTAHVPTLEPYAQFVDVHGILYNPLSAAPLPLPGWDLDKTLNMSAGMARFLPTIPTNCSSLAPMARELR